MSEYTVDGWNNFCRVFELPKEFPNDFCFGGGIPVRMKMVDWFQPCILPTPAVSKEIWIKEIGEIETQTVTEDTLKEKLLPWLKSKIYVRRHFKYLVIFDFGCSIIFTQ